MPQLRFDECFPEEKLDLLEDTLPQTYRALNKLAPWRRGKWPTRVHCMSDSDIIAGRIRGAGHGATYIGGNDIWMNHYMSPYGLWLVLVHENLHHAFPDATEDELNSVLVPWVHREVFGEDINLARAKRHGLGPPCPWGDRGFVGNEVPDVCR